LKLIVPYHFKFVASNALIKINRSTAAILDLENQAFSLSYENAKKFSQITKATHL